MTRFARAKGSKASNERVPEDSTPWEVMKEQLLQAKKDSDDSKNRKEAEQKRIENYENFLKERKVQKRNATWCDFPDGENQLALSNEPQHSKKKKKNNKKDETEKPESVICENINGSNNEANTDDSLNKLKKRKKNTRVSDSESKTTCNVDVSLNNKLKKKTQETSEIELETQTNPSTVESVITNKRSKKKQKNKPNESFLNSTSTENTTVDNVPNKDKEKNKQVKNKKNKKLVDGKPVRRKALNDNSYQLIINGKEVELLRFEGFPIMKKDAERLQELKASMMKKGIPKSEVQRTIKLERRRAEKALARVKREVCYNCRKGGHILSDCPDLKSKIPGAEGADGVCFKCGSTEHRQFECKVQRDKEFRFATCFICKEPGHIARQCPDNPKGLYPNGGSCKLCGDVTHLRKDCPTVTEQKEEKSVKLQTLDNGDNIEDVGLQSNKLIPTESNKKPKKVKF